MACARGEVGIRCVRVRAHTPNHCEHRSFVFVPDKQLCREEAVEDEVCAELNTLRDHSHSRSFHFHLFQLRTEQTAMSYTVIELEPIGGGMPVHAAEPKTPIGVNAPMTGDDGVQEQLIDETVKS
jgi:hypothetical protein